MSSACDGLRVVDFGFWMAGPLATMVLADNGAEVIKVEPPEGDPARRLPAFQTWNRGKKSVVLDLKTPEGRDKALALARDADAVVVAMRPGTPQKLGIDYESLRSINPRLVYTSITGYGEDGPWSRLKGYDGLVTARSGRMMMFERVADRPGPAFPSLPCASYTAAMLSVQGVMAALHRRAETGRGQKVSVSLLASLIPFDLIMWIGWQLRGDEIDATGQPANMVLQKLLGERQLAQKPGSYDPRQLHRPQVRVPRPNYLTAVTKDGVWLQFANTMDHLCVAQMTALGLLDLYGQERFAKLPAVFTEEDAEELWQTILERVRSKTYEEWQQVFEKDGNIAVERIRTPLESLQHRQVLHNGQVVEVPSINGQTTLQPGPLARFDKTPAAIRSGAPALGQHTSEVLGGLPAGPPQRDEPPPAPAGTLATKGPLTGITVVDFSAWIAAPYATAILSNLGARVIRVEPVGGEVSRYSTGGLLSFPMTQGKESIAVDLKHPEGLKIVRSLIAGGDGLVHNFRPGVPKRLGIDYETCRALNPGLIYLNAASYGDTGPDAHRPMFFATAAALGGNQLRQVGKGHPAPGSETASIEDLKQEAWRLLKAAEGNADPIAAVATAAAFLMALHARDRTGSGQAVLTTMIGSDIYANSDDAIAYRDRPSAPVVDEALYGYGPFYRLYETASGWIFLACVQSREWVAFCRAAGRPDMEPEWEHAAAGGGEALAHAIGAVLRERTADQWESLMAEHDVPLVAVELRDPGRFNIQDPEMRRQGHAVQVESPAHGPYWRHGALQQFSEDGATLGGWEPLGGHTNDILQELGYATDEIERLAAEQVVEIWSPESEQVQV